MRLVSSMRAIAADRHRRAAFSARRRDHARWAPLFARRRAPDARLCSRQARRRRPSPRTPAASRSRPESHNRPANRSAARQKSAPTAAAANRRAAPWRSSWPRRKLELGEIERPAAESSGARVCTAVTASPARHRDPGGCSASPRPGKSAPMAFAVAGGRAENAETVERAQRREQRRAVNVRGARRCSAAPSFDMRADAFEHFDEKPGNRQVRPVRVGADMEQHDDPLAAPLGGRERRAVGEPRPGLGGEARVGLGQNLTLFTATSAGTARPKNGLASSKSASRLGVSHDIAPPSTRPLRRSLTGVEIVGVVGEARSGETQQHPALLDKIRQAPRKPLPARPFRRRAPARWGGRPGRPEPDRRRRDWISAAA